MMLKHGEGRLVLSFPLSLTEFRFLSLDDVFCGASVWELSFLREKPPGLHLRKDPAGPLHLLTPLLFGMKAALP